MYEMRIDAKKNRIYITLGVIETGDGEKLYSETKEKYGNALNLAKTLDGAEEILDAQEQGN